MVTLVNNAKARRLNGIHSSDWPWQLICSFFGSFFKEETFQLLNKVNKAEGQNGWLVSDYIIVVGITVLISHLSLSAYLPCTQDNLQTLTTRLGLITCDLRIINGTLFSHSCRASVCSFGYQTRDHFAMIRCTDRLTKHQRYGQES